jgi:hypothetical protein
MGVVAVVLLAVVSQSTLRSVSGVEEATDLQAILRPAYASILAPQPPLNVFRVPPSAEWKGFRWKVEATLRAGLAPVSGEVRAAVDRMVLRCLRTRVMGRPPAGVMVVLHAAGSEDATFLFDGEGRPVPQPSAGPPPPAPGAGR